MQYLIDFIDNTVEKIAGRKINKGILQYFRYLICGGIATLTDISLLFILTHVFPIHYLLAAALSFMAGITVNYSLNVILVFRSSGEIKKEFPLFALIGIGGLVWTEIIIWILVDWFNLYVMFAKGVAIILVLQWNFFMRKRFVFSLKQDFKKKKEGQLRILSIAATPFFSDRGCHIRIYNEAKYLQELGAKVKICTYFSGENVLGLDIERIKKVSWYKRTAPGFSWGKFWLDVKLIFLCRRVIREFQPSAIHAHLYEGLGVGYIAKWLAWRHIPIVVDLQGYLDEEFRTYNQKNFIARKIFVWLSKRLIHRSDWVVLSGENLLPYMQKLVCSKEAISIIRDGIDLDLFKETSFLKDQELREMEMIKKWKNGGNLLVYIGGLSDNKGIGDLLKAFSKLDFENLGWKLLIGGFGQDEEKYKKFIEESGLRNFVYFLGRVRYFSLPAYLALAEAAIDPKNNSAESSGKLVNYMASGLPIVCFDNNFNQARLGEKGLYINDFSDLESVLCSFGGSKKIDYELENHGEEKEARKLFEIFRSLVKCY